MSRFAVILPAAGQSRRFAHARRKKPFAELRGRALWLRSVDLFAQREDVVQTLICVAEADFEWFKDAYRADLAFRKVEVVIGGAERADSVENALSAVRDEVDYIGVHDAARPLMIAAWIDAVFQAAQQFGAAIPAIPIASTVKRVEEGAIRETVRRDDLYQAQTPQVFRAELLRRAFAKREGFSATDEAQLVERLGERVHIVPGNPMNFKITTRDDLRMAEAVLEALPKKKGLDAIAPGKAKPSGRLLDWLEG